MIQILRKGILLYILIIVAVGDWLLQQRLASWDRTLWVAVYPVNGDGSETSQRYIESLTEEKFEKAADYFKQQAQGYGVSLSEPVKFQLASSLSEQPPLPPRAGNMLEVAWWSLKLRWWAWRLDEQGLPIIDVQIVVRYFDPEQTTRVAHSLGLQKGRIGIVNAFADRRNSGGNRVVIAHELLHTLGATDKYSSATNLPLFPDGYAEPKREPLYPQRRAELMGGRIPLSRTKAEIPRRLSKTTIGSVTAKEIGWQRK